MRLSSLLLSTIALVGCDDRSKNQTMQTGIESTDKETDKLEAEPWVSKPKIEWPQIVLTNQADFEGHTPLRGASSFLVKNASGKVFAATAEHLIGSAGGVEPAITTDQLTSKILSWKIFPRTRPDDAVEIDSLGVIDLGSNNNNRDWLVLAVKETDAFPAYPLRVRKRPVEIGEKVFLIGCPYGETECQQNVYTGKITERAYGDRFRYDISPPVDIRGFSGAPIVDKDGLAVGVTTIWFDPKMSGDDFLEAGGEDIASIYDAISNAR